MLIVILIVLSFAGIVYAEQGVIDDPGAGLQWVTAPNQAMNWDEAKTYATNLSLAGGGCRLPTRAELRSLYGRLSSLGGADKFGVAGKWAWSSELYANEPSLAWYVDLGNGYEIREDRRFDYHSCALAVRSRR